MKSFYVTFNLDNRQPVKYELVDMTGKQVGGKELIDVLNQTYKIDVENASSGIYLVRLLIDKKYYVSRIVVIPIIYNNAVVEALCTFVSWRLSGILN